MNLTITLPIKDLKSLGFNSEKELVDKIMKYLQNTKKADDERGFFETLQQDRLREVWEEPELDVYNKLLEDEI